MPGPYRKPFAAGDVVWGPDAFHDDDPTLRRGGQRPWLVLNNESFPGHGTQYLYCGLTHNLAPAEAFLRLEPKDWEKGGAPLPSQVDTETLFTMKQRWVTDYSGRLSYGKLLEVRRKVKGWL